MRDRNVGKTQRFPAWGERFAANVATDGNEWVSTRAASAPPAITSGKTPKGRFSLSSLPLTAFLAVLVSTSASAQQTAPAPEAAPQQEAAQTPPAAPTVTVPVIPIVPKGRIRILVRDAITKDYLDGAAVFLDDPTLTDIRTIPYYSGDVRTDASNVTIGGAGFAITDPLAVHQWIVVVIKEGYQTGRAIVTVRPDATVDVEVFLRLRERTESFILLATRDTTNNTRRTLEFGRNIPVAAGNRQNINNIIASAPGFVRDSLGQIHPRGQRFGVSTYIDGFLMPSLPTGLLQGFLPQDMVAQYDIRSGGLSAEYGGDSGVAVDLTMRKAGTIPIVEGMLTSGGLGTDEAYISVGQRFDLHRGKYVEGAARDQAAINRAQGPAPGIGGSFAAPGTERKVLPNFGYFLSVSQRNTNVVTEAPQKKSTLNNSGYNNVVYGRVEFNPSPLAQITGLINVNGGRSGIANRNKGGGTGFLGRVDSGQSLPSQDEEYQDQYQKENNSLALVQLRRVLRPRDQVSNPDSTFSLSFGGLESELRLENQNRNFDPRDLTDPNSPLYKKNSSLEFNPTIHRYYDQSQAQAEVVLAKASHIVKGGVLVNGFRSQERYQFQPGSQYALNALYAKSAILVPTNVVLDTSNTSLDPYGNRYVKYATEASATTPPYQRSAEAPLKRITREGEYSSYYIQDTWGLNQVFTINSGLRFESYQLSAISGSSNGRIAGSGKTDTTVISPRLNFAFQLPRRGWFGFISGRGSRKAILRASYDRLFQRPPIGQGSYFSSAPIRPQTADAWELGLEKQLGPQQVVKATIYDIRFQNFLDVEGLFPGSQLSTGALLLVNYPRALSQGLELTYNYNPTFRNGNPLTLFATYTNGSIKLQARGRSYDSLGRLVTAERPDFDQKHTLNFGLSYRLPKNSTIGMSTYLGSGLYGSRQPGSDKRDSIAEVNLRYSSSPRLFHNSYGVDVSIENLFDQQNRYNYYTNYEASRIQTGRRLLTSVYARF